MKLIGLWILSLGLTFFAQTADPEARTLQITPLYTLEGHLDSVNDVAFSPDDMLLVSVGEDTSVRGWSPETGELLFEGYEQSSFVKNIAFNPQNPAQFATASWDQSALIWEYDGTEAVGIQPFAGYMAVVQRVAFNPDGSLLAVGAGDGRVRLYDVETAEEIQSLQLNALQVTALAFLSEEILATAAGFPTTEVQLWDTQTGELVDALSGHEGTVTAISTAADLIATGSDDGTVRLWQDDTEIAVLEQADWVTDVALNADGTLLAVALQNGSIHIWNTETQTEITTLTGHTSQVNAVAFNFEGTLLASGGDDSTVRVWEVTTE